jgi:hypothetical protein
MSGIKAWNDPKKVAIVKAFLILRCLMITPLAIDTAKASIANPNAMPTVTMASIGL